MTNDNFIFSTKAIEISETKTYLEITNLVCTLDEANLNGARIYVAEAELYKDTLLAMPVVAKVIKNKDGELDFTGHNVSIKKDEKGNEQLVFNTDAFGTYTDIWIGDAKLEDGSDGKALFAKGRIWKRFGNATKVVKRLFKEGNLSTSWEIQPYEVEYLDDGTRKLKRWEFIGNCLLGEKIQPAYKQAAVTLLSQSQFMLAEAIAEDITELDINAKKEDDVMEGTEYSSVTMRDLYQKLETAIEHKMDRWFNLSLVFPEEHLVWAYSWDRESELDYYKFTYTVNESDEVEVSDGTLVKLNVAEASEVDSIKNKLVDVEKLVAEKLVVISELETNKNELSTQLAEKTDGLVSAMDVINGFEIKIAELSPFKEMAEKAELEKQFAETAQKREVLKAKLIQSKLVTSEEIETSEEIKEMLDAIDEKSVKSLIADRFMDKLSQEVTPVTEVSTVVTDELSNDGIANLNADEDSETINKGSVMSAFLKKQ